MQYDLLHAVVAGVLVFITIKVAEATGLYTRNTECRFQWSWPLFGMLFVVFGILNLIWPYS